MLTTRAESSTLTSSIHALASGTRRAVTQAETIGTRAASRLERPMDALQHNLEATRERFEEARRTALENAQKIAGTVAEHGRTAFGDTVDLVQRTTGVRTLPELLALHSDYASRRGIAAMKVIEDLNAIGRSQAMALWSPMTKAVEQIASPAAPAKAAIPKPATAAKASRAAAVKRSGRKPAMAAKTSARTKGRKAGR